MNQQNMLKITNIKEIKNLKTLSDSCCCCSTRWFFSILVWGSILGIILLENEIVFYILLPLFYINYLLLEFYSPSFFFVRSKSNSKFNKIMSDYFKNTPKIKFEFTKLSSNGYTTNSCDFIINSCQDKSEEWILSKEELKRKYFIKFTIVSEIYSDDVNTVNEYNSKRQNFIATVNSNNVYTKINYENLSNECFICLDNEKCSFYVNCCVFLLFAILSFGEIYTLILKVMTLEKSFLVKKVITARNENVPILGSNIIGNQVEDEMEL